MKRTWLVAGTIAAVATLAFGTTQAVGLIAHDEETEVYAFPVDGIAALDVRTESGSIEVDGGDVDEITVVAEISHGLQGTDHTVEVEGDTLVLDSDCPVFGTWCEVDFRIVVPVATAVEARSPNGRVTLRDLTGPVAVDADNGTVELVRLSGAVQATSDNGRIEGIGLRSATVDVDTDNGRLTLTFAQPPDAITATADNGRVEVVLPDTEDTYRVRADTDEGSTDVGIRTDPASNRTIDIDSDNGDVTVRYPTG